MLSMLEVLQHKYFGQHFLLVLTSHFTSIFLVSTDFSSSSSSHTKTTPDEKDHLLLFGKCLIFFLPMALWLVCVCVGLLQTNLLAVVPLAVYYVGR